MVALPLITGVPRDGVVANRPLAFEKESDFEFAAVAEGYRVFLSGAAPELRLGTADDSLRINFEGANPDAKPIGEEPRADSTLVQQFRRVWYHDLYPGIDVVFYGSGGNVEFDFVVSRGVDISRICLHYSREGGPADLSVDSDGAVRIDTKAGRLRQPVPVVYQEMNGQRFRINGKYRLIGDSRLQFELGEYDRSLPVVIDPVLQYVNVSGTADNDEISAIAVDTAGAVYACGYSLFHVSSGFQSVGFLKKLSRDGSSFVYSDNTGNACSAVGVDAQGSAYISLGSSVRKVDPTGATVVWETSIPGSIAALTLDPSGNVYATGQPGTQNFPVTGGAFQMPGHMGDDAFFIVKLNPSGSIVYSTVIARGLGKAIAVDALGNIVVSGTTKAADFPVTANAAQSQLSAYDPPPPGCYELECIVYPYDAFVLKLNAAGSAVLYGTYLGGKGNDSAESVAISPGGEIWVGGSGGNGIITANPLGLTGVPNFLARIASSGALAFAISTPFYFGHMAQDSNGNAYVAGNASTIPATPGAIQTQRYGVGSGLIEIDPTGKLVYGTYLAGLSIQGLVPLAIDAVANVYVAGTTIGGGIPPTSGSYAGLDDIEIAKLNMAAPLCSVAVSGSVPSTVPYTGASINFSMTAPAGCVWVASATGGAAVTFSNPVGMGSGSVTATVAANNGPDPLLSTLNINGTTYSFTQGTAPCTYRVSPTYYVFEPWGGYGDVQVTTAPGCAWTVTSLQASNPYAGPHVIPPASGGSGPGTFRFQAQPGVNDTVYVGNGNAQASFPVGTTFNKSTPDFFGNGNPVLVWQAPGGGQAQIWSLTPTTSPVVANAASVSAAPGWNIVGVGDMNSDNLPDIVWQNANSGDSQVWFMSSGQVSGAAVLSGSTTARIAAARHFSAYSNQGADLFWQDPQSGAVTGWEMSGDRFVDTVNFSSANSWRLVATGDFDNDTYTDLVWQSPVTGESQIWLMRGTAIREVRQLSGPNAWRIVAASDFNKDGRMDIVWQSQQTGEAQIWYLGGVSGTDILGVATISGLNTWRIVGPK